MFKRMSVVICGLAVTLMTAGVASAQTATQETKAKTKSAAKKTGDAVEKGAQKTENAAKKVGSAITDASITTAVKTKLLADSKVGGLKIDVDTEKHVVTLTGVVNSAAEKAEALRLARTTKGVRRVVSKLTIGPK